MTSDRRRFLKLATTTGLAALLPFQQLLAQHDPAKGMVMHAADHETWLIGPRRAPVTIAVDKKKKGVGNICLCWEDMEGGSGIPVHKHLNEDELIYLPYGEGSFVLGDEQHIMKAGSVAFVPRGTWHGLSNTGKEALRMIFSFTPSGFENYFREIGFLKGTTPLDLEKVDWKGIDEKYGIVYKR